MITTKNDPVSASSVVTQHDKTTRPVNFIRFHGLTLLVVENGGIEYTEAKPLTDLCGIHWKSAKVTLKSGDNAVLYGTTALFPPKIDGVGSASTPQNEALYIRLDRSRIFLARVSTSQMRAQGNVVAAETLLALQIEWAEALHSYETNGIAVKKGRREDLGDLGLLYKLRGMAKTPEERAALARQIADHHKEMGYPLTPDRQQGSLFEGGAV